MASTPVPVPISSTTARLCRLRDNVGSDPHPCGSAKAVVAKCSDARLSASASALFCAVEASLESRATTVAMGEGSGIARLSFVPSPAFTADYPKPASANPQNAQQPYSVIVHGIARAPGLGFEPLLRVSANARRRFAQGCPHLRGLPARTGKR